MRKVLGATGARVAEVDLAVCHAHERLDGAGRLTDPAEHEALRDAMGALLGELDSAELAS